MKRTPLLLIGGGGHCKSCIDVIETGKTYRVAGIVDRPAMRDKKLLGYPYVGTDDDLPALLRKTPDTLISIGFSRGGQRRKALYEMIHAKGGKTVTVVSALAHVSRHAELEDGTIVMHQALVNAGSHIGANSVINSQALVEHDCTIGRHCHIATGARINGGCHIGDECLIGSGAILLPGISIAPGTCIGAGALVTRNIERAGTWVGNPARPLEKSER